MNTSFKASRALVLCLLASVSVAAQARGGGGKARGSKTRVTAVQKAVEADPAPRLLAAPKRSGSPGYSGGGSTCTEEKRQRQECER